MASYILSLVIMLYTLVAAVVAQSSCKICPNDSNDIGFPERVIPFFNLNSGNQNPTCQDLVNALSAEEDENNIDCKIVQAQAGYCGCEGVSPINQCSLCPDGQAPALPNVVAPTSDRCGDLDTYISFLSGQDCQSPRFQSMQGLAFSCGCLGVKPACTMCPDGSEPPAAFLDKEAQATGETCAEMAQLIQGFTSDVCFDSDTTLLISAARCGCPDSEVPVCSIQQNPHLCTDELLDSIPPDALEEDCECYAFCDGIFNRCHNFPGGLLNTATCPGVPVSGCNRARARRPPVVVVDLPAGTSAASIPRLFWIAGVVATTILV